MTPRAIVVKNAKAYLLAHSAVFAGLLYSLHRGDLKAVKICAFMLAFLGPWCLVSTYLSAIRAWRGEPPNESADVSIPFVAFAAVLLPLYLLL